MPYDRRRPSLQHEQSAFRSGVRDPSPFGPRRLISVLPSWLSIKIKVTERERRWGGEAKLESVVKPLWVNSFLFNPSPSRRKRLCGDGTKGR